jgi:hypothetical protein
MGFLNEIGREKKTTVLAGGSRCAPNFIQKSHTVLKNRLWESRITPILEKSRKNKIFIISGFNGGHRNEKSRPACRLCLNYSDIGRIYIKGYLYPISYPKIAKKDIPLSFF